jgi:hypothetical protein
MQVFAHPTSLIIPTTSARKRTSLFVALLAMAEIPVSMPEERRLL